MESLIVPFIILVVALIAWGLYSAAKRRKALAAWAASRGLRFVTTRDRDMDERFTEFKCLRQGGDRYAYNASYGDWSGRAMIGFDYHYETGSGKDRSSHHFSAVIIESHIPLKPLHIRREHLFDKVSEFFGVDDIDFESAEFSRKFHVKSPDKRWAYDVIHARMMEYLLGAPKFSIQFAGRHVIAWRLSRFGPAEFEAGANLICGILDRLPEYVVQQQKGETAS